MGFVHVRYYLIAPAILYGLDRVIRFLIGFSPHRVLLPSLPLTVLFFIRCSSPHFWITLCINLLSRSICLYAPMTLVSPVRLFAHTCCSFSLAHFQCLCVCCCFVLFWFCLFLCSVTVFFVQVTRVVLHNNGADSITELHVEVTESAAQTRIMNDFEAYSLFFHFFEMQRECVCSSSSTVPRFLRLSQCVVFCLLFAVSR